MAAIMDRSDDVDARLVEDIREAPGDDGPRLVWADAVGGDRGEFVVLQLGAQDLVRKRRQRELLARHGDQWSGLLGLATRVSFHRGFVDAAQIDARVLLEHADAIFEAAPCLAALTVTGAKPDMLPALCALRIDGLDLDGGDRALATLAQTKLLDRLRALSVRGRLSMDGIRVLIERAPALEVLWMRQVDEGAVHRLLTAGRVDHLRSFGTGGLTLTPYDSVLPRGLAHVVLRELGPEIQASLAPLAQTLEHVETRSGALDMAPYAAFPRLRTLSIGEPSQRLEPEAASRARLHARHVPALRELSLGGAIHERLVRILVEELGPQLDLLDLRANPAALRYVNELAPRVRGELLVGPREPAPPLLRTVPITQLPWWDHVTLES